MNPGVLTALQLKPMAMLFTNSGGGVVFANRNYLRLTKQSSARTVAGARLETLLPIEPGSAARMLHAIGHNDVLERLPISVNTTTGSIFPALFSGIAAHDEKGNFIGADILLNEPGDDLPPSPGGPVPSHADVLGAYVGEVFRETAGAAGKTFMQAYVVAQADMLQVLLARLGGPEMRRTFERILNEAARKNQIWAGMENGFLEFTQKSMDFGAYRTLLVAAVGYAVSAIGQHMVAQEMQAVDRYVDPGMLELLTQMNLRDIFRGD